MEEKNKKKKKNTIRESYIWLKKIRKNPRLKGVTDLCAWILFFIFMYFAAVACSALKAEPRLQESKVVKKTHDYKENYKNMKSFKYNMDIELEYDIENSDMNKKEYSVEGIYYESKNFITCNDEEYYDDGSNVYHVNHEDKKLEISYEEVANITSNVLSPINLYSFIHDGKEIERTEYGDGKVELVIENDTMKIELSINDYYITEIFFSSGDKYSGIAKSLEANIKYSDINNIKYYSKNYEDYEREEEFIDENQDGLEESN